MDRCFHYFIDPSTYVYMISRILRHISIALSQYKDWKQIFHLLCDLNLQSWGPILKKSLSQTYDI